MGYCKKLFSITFGNFSISWSFQCENENQDNDALYEFHDNDFYNSNCAKPCSIIQYTRKLDYWDSWEREPNDSIFILYIRFAPPLTTKVYKEYLIYDIFGMIGSVGGTLGIFIGFSFSGMLSFITHIFKNLPYKNIKDKSAIICNCIPQKSSDN